MDRRTLSRRTLIRRSLTLGALALPLALGVMPAAKAEISEMTL